MNTPAARIRQVRLFHGWTQEGFAVLFRVSRRTVLRWEERGTHFADPDLFPDDYHARCWSTLCKRFDAAARHRLTADGVVEIITSEAENSRLDGVTFATRGALDALAKKRHV